MDMGRKSEENDVIDTDKFQTSGKKFNYIKYLINKTIFILPITKHACSPERFTFYH